MSRDDQQHDAVVREFEPPPEHPGNLKTRTRMVELDLGSHAPVERRHENRSRDRNQHLLEFAMRVDTTIGLFSRHRHEEDPFDWEGACINPPEPAIVAVGATVDTPIVRDGEVVVRPITTVTLSCDHLATSGAGGAALLQSFKKRREQPVLLLA
jgi:hypothetical protein